MSINATAEPFSHFDGINDFSQILTNVVNTVAAVVRNRAISFINGGDMYPMDDLIENVINTVLEAHGMPWVLPGDKGLYLDGFFWDNIQSQNDQMIVKLKT